MRRKVSVRSSSRRVGRLRATDRQRETAERERRRERIRSELTGWREARAKDERAYQAIVRDAATNDPNGRSRETYRAMHALCDRVWAERIQLKKTELAALMIPAGDK